MAEIVNEEQFRAYFNAFVTEHRIILNPKLNYVADAVVSTKQGALIFFQFKPEPEGYQYRVIDEPIGKALEDIPQRAIGGNIAGVRFGGTNVIREGDKLIIIKGDNTSEGWSVEIAKRDALKEVADIRDSIAHPKN